jgi:hypothetical protein
VEDLEDGFLGGVRVSHRGRSGKYSASPGSSIGLGACVTQVAKGYSTLFGNLLAKFHAWNFCFSKTEYLRVAQVAEGQAPRYRLP